MTTLSENAKWRLEVARRQDYDESDIGSAHARIDHLAEVVAELAAIVERLAKAEVSA